MLTYLQRDPIHACNNARSSTRRSRMVQGPQGRGTSMAVFRTECTGTLPTTPQWAPERTPVSGQGLSRNAGSVRPRDPTPKAQPRQEPVNDRDCFKHPLPQLVCIRGIARWRRFHSPNVQLPAVPTTRVYRKSRVKPPAGLPSRRPPFGRLPRST